MKKLSILSTNAFGTIAIGVVIISASYFLVIDTFAPGFFLYILIIGLFNLFITAFVHALIYVPYVNFNSNERLKGDDTINDLLLGLGAVFLTFLVFFVIAVDGDWTNPYNGQILVAAFAILSTQTLGAHFLSKKLKLDLS